MRKRLGVAAAVGLAVALVVPSAAMAHTQNLRAGFADQKINFKNVDPSTPFPFPVFGPAQPSKKKGTVAVEVSITGHSRTADAPSAQTADIHLPQEMKFTTKNVPTVNPADLAGLSPADLAPFKNAKVGQGGARALGLGGVGPVNAYNGTKVNGNPSIVLHSFAANTPIVLVGELRNSPLGPPYGKDLHVPVSTDVGGGVPPGIVIDLFNTTVSKTVKKKSRADATAAKKKKKKKKKQYVSVKKCDDGVLTYQAAFTYANAPPQAPVVEQPCG